MISKYDTKDFVASTHPLNRHGSGLLQSGVGDNHPARDKVLADAEVFKRTLRLCASELVGWNIDFTGAVSFFPSVCHKSSSECGMALH